MATLMDAHNQWASRPPDERFSNVRSMFSACFERTKRSAEREIEYRSLRVEATGSDLRLVGQQGVSVGISHYAFGQLARSIGAPAEYLRDLPATLAAQNLNHGLKRRGDNEDRGIALLTPVQGDWKLRALTSERYDRVWNHEVIGRVVLPLIEEQGWKQPPARPAQPGAPGTRLATAADVIPGSFVRVGDTISPAGLYASDHDMFAIALSSEAIQAPGGLEMRRGIMVGNSEVGAGSLWFKLFLWMGICGNHILHGVTEVNEVRVKHLKGEVTNGQTLNRAVRNLRVTLTKYEEQAAGQEEASLKLAASTTIGSTKDEVLEAVYNFAKGKNMPSLTQKVITAGYDVAEAKRAIYGPPNTVWGMVNGLTEYSQLQPYQDVRFGLDRDAGKLMQMAQ